MSTKFSLESIEYLTEKLNNSQYLSDESLVYLTLQISELISNLLQDACKFLRKCHRKDLTTDDFALALKLNSIEPMYGGYTTSNMRHILFRKIKKDNRILYQIDDNIIPLENLINTPVEIPLDISIRAHWLAVNGKQMIINENPIIDKPIRTISQKKSNKKSHILSMEQQIYYKELIEMCICTNEKKRKQALLILSSDNSLQQIISRLILFISEGIRINLTPNPTSNRSINLNFLMQMIEALLKNNELFLEPYLHYLLPAILSCLLDRRISEEHWLLRDLSAKCCGQILRKYSTAANGLQQRTIDIFYRILNRNENEYIWTTQYGAFIGLCEMSHQVIIQIVFPLVKQIGEKIRMMSNTESSQKLTEVVIKFIISAYRSVDNENEKKLYEDFGSYFAPLIHQQLILLL